MAMMTSVFCVMSLNGRHCGFQERECSFLCCYSVWLSLQRIGAYVIKPCFTMADVVYVCNFW
jgi:hypothetical protein